jgi:hypothetical protein
MLVRIVQRTETRERKSRDRKAAVVISLARCQIGNRSASRSTHAQEFGSKSDHGNEVESSLRRLGLQAGTRGALAPLELRARPHQRSVRRRHAGRTDRKAKGRPVPSSPRQRRRLVTESVSTRHRTCTDFPNASQLMASHFPIINSPRRPEPWLPRRGNWRRRSRK